MRLALSLTGPLGILALTALASPARGQEVPANPPPAAVPPAPAQTPPLTEGERARLRAPWGILPLFQYESVDYERLGPDPAGRPLRSLLDVDLLAPLIGWHNEERYATADEPAGNRGYAYAMPLLWAAWDPAGTDAYLAPLGGFSSRRDGWRAYVFPLAATAGTGPDGWDASLLWPILSAGRERDTWWARAMPLAWAAGDVAGAYAGILPLFWYQAHHATGRGWLASPLVAHGHGKTWSFTATPVSFSWRDRARGRGVDIAPCFVAAHGRGWDAQVFVPFGFRYATDDGRSVAAIPPFYLGASDKDGGWWTAPPGLIHVRRGTRTFDAWFPIAGRSADAATGDHLTWALPVGFSRKSGATSTTLLANYFAYDDATRAIRYLFPFGGMIRSGDRTRWHVLFPLASVESDAKAGLTQVDVLAPLAQWRRDGQRTAWRVLPVAFGDAGKDYARAVVMPFVYHKSSGDRSATAVLPLFAYRSRGETSELIAPLVWARNGPGTRDRVLFPFYWDIENPGSDGRTLLALPFGGYRRRTNGDWWASVLGPACIVSGDASGKRLAVDVAAPLFHYGRDDERFAWWATPLVFGEGDADGARAVALPLFAHRHDRERSSTVCLPLFASHRDVTESHGVAPFAWWRNAPGVRERVGFPFYWDIERRAGSSFHVWPFYGRDTWNNPKGEVAYERTSVLFPFFRSWEDKVRGAAGWDAPWPFVGGYTSPEAAETRLLPLLHYARTGRDWRCFAAPCFYGDGNGTQHRWMLFPLAAYWSDASTGNAFGIAPLFHYAADRTGANFSFAFPLVYGTSRGPDRWSARLLWEVLAVEQDGPAAFEWRLLGGLASYRAQGDERSFGLNPLLYVETKGDRYTYWSVLSRLYAYEREGTRTRHHFLWWFSA